MCPSTSLVVSKSSKGGVAVRAAMATPKAADEPMDVDECEDKSRPHASESDSDSDSEESGNQPGPMPMPMPALPPPPPMWGRGQGGVRGGGGGQRGQYVGRGVPLFNPFNPNADDSFGGRGHRLGGREDAAAIPGGVESAVLSGESFLHLLSV